MVLLSNQRIEISINLVKTMVKMLNSESSDKNSKHDWMFYLE